MPIPMAVTIAPLVAAPLVANGMMDAVPAPMAVSMALTLGPLLLAAGRMIWISRA